VALCAVAIENTVPAQSSAPAAKAVPASKFLIDVMFCSKEDE
jgi:hypothetical protein